MAAALALALAQAGTASAQGADGPFAGFKHDRSEPIEITSDALEVRQAEELAIFSGAVIAGQGTLRLEADRVEVSYDQEESSGDTGAIKKMRAEGNVFLTNGAETAKGAWAEYDVVSGMMFMGGSDNAAVILTQGNNAISGQRLVINLNDGTGRMEGGAKGRVKSLFAPAQTQQN